jgi:hypothetical protein
MVVAEPKKADQRLARLLKAAELRQQHGHDVLCAALNDRPRRCNCGHGALARALAAYEVDGQGR